MLPQQSLTFVVLAFVIAKSTAEYEEMRCGISQMTTMKGNGDEEKENLEIVGAVEVRRGSWPFVAYLQYKNEFQLCGAVVLRKSWVLTAGHCVENITQEPETLTVAVGSHSIYKKEPESTKKIVDYIVLPPKYLHMPTKYDIALIHLASPLNFSQSPHVVPVCLPQLEEELPEGTNVYVVGWGTGKTGQEFPSNLKQAKFLLIPYEVCLKLQRENGRQLPDENIFCIIQEKGHHACNGERGGTVFAQDGDSWVLQGIVSRGPFPNCEEIEGPYVITNVAYHLDWMNLIMKYYQPKKHNFE